MIITSMFAVLIYIIFGLPEITEKQAKALNQLWIWLSVVEVVFWIYLIATTQITDLSFYDEMQ